MSWDLFCKALVKECPQDFVTYFAPNARFTGMNETNLQTRVDGPLDPREIREDVILGAELLGTHFLIGVEWQSSKDSHMDERLLGYSYEVTRVQSLNMLPCVIYTRPVNNIPRAPLERHIPIDHTPGKRRMIWFDFESLDLCNMLVKDLQAYDLDAFFVPSLLCKDGGTPATLETVLRRLLRRSNERKESIAAAFFFAGEVLKSDEDRKFLERKYAMLDEMLQGNWMYEKMLEEGCKKGLKIGREEGMKEGRIEEARQNISLFIEKRFPSLLPLVQPTLIQINDEDTLQEVMIDLFTANTLEEATTAFSAHC